MLISVWWAVAAFLLGGTGGVLALALLSGMPDRNDRESVQFSGISPTQ